MNASRASKGAPPTKGAPGKNLPNLDEVRRRGPAHPKALPPVSSRHKKCPPDEPDCDARGKAGNGSPAPEDAPLSGSAAALPSARVLLGALAAGALNPYGGVSLASTTWWLPEPPHGQDKDARDVESSGWLSTLAGGLWAGPAARRAPQGYFDYAGCDAVAGWAWDSAQPNTPIMVSLFSGSELVATVLADQYRQDLVNVGIGDGRHGFHMTLPDSLRDGAAHSLSVRIQFDGTDFTLGSSPRALTCTVPAYEGAITSADCDQITGWAWDTGRPTTPIDVDVYVDGAFRARASADAYNAQLGKGDNRHQFRLPTPVAARDGQPHSITVRPAGSGQSLGSPASVTCTGPTYQGYIDWASCDYAGGWVWDSQRPNSPVNVDIYSDGQFVTSAAADIFGQDLVNVGIGNGRHRFQVAIPDSLRNGSQHTLTAYISGGGPPVTGSVSITCAARPGCSASQSLPSTEFVKDFYSGALARQPKSLELQYWNDALRDAAAQGQTALLAKAKLLGRELFLEGEYAGRGRMATGHESEYVNDLYWAYLQRGPDAGGLNFWAGNIQSQGQAGWLNALSGFENSGEFVARVAAVCPAPAESVSSYDAAADFSPLQNADGAWAYGYKATSGSAFALYPAHVQTTSPPPAYDTWYQPSITDPYLTPLVRRISGAQNLLLHPGPQGQQTVVRWTAPAAATVVIAGHFDAAGPATTDVHVRLNSSVALFDGNINGTGSSAPFSLTRAVAAGDTIEFAVGYGSNGTYYSDGTTLAVAVTQQPPAQTQAYNGTAAQLPGNIEAELFDAGGEGVAYHDTTAGTHGLDQNQSPQPPTAFRSPTDVDIYKHVGYSNGYLVVMQAGDWMNYTVDVAQSGSYTLEARTSYWSATGGLFHVEADGVDITGPLQHTAGSGFQTVTKPGVQLNAGRHVLRVVCDTNGTDGVYMGSLDYLRLTTAEDAGLVARWRFDEGSGTTALDSTGNGSAGTVGGGATWSSGIVGSNSLNFNGTTGYVSVASPSSALSSVSNNFTISLWARPRSAHEIDPEGVTGVAGVSGQRYAFGPSNSGNTTESGAGVSVGTNGVSVYEHGAGYMPATIVYQGAVNGWTHVAVVYENRQPKLYLNGQLVRTGNTSPMSVVRATPWNLGGNSYGYFDGLVDDVRVYGRVLSAGEIGALVGAGGVDPTGSAFSEAKKDPVNQTGAGGDDPLSRNFNFSVPLVGLKGRAGLDLGLSLSYNSLVWTRDASANAVKFDSDYGDPSPGFRLGLPVIHRRYQNARGENAYMLVTTSGERVELRQLGTSNTYEATDSSYTQLTEDNGLTLRPPDGSQLSFTLKGYEFKCTQIKDRNGNFITASYNAAGNVSSITDTLGRVINFTYDANNRPLSIEQNRGGQTHQWATFAYASQTITAGFAAGVNVSGPANGTSISVLSRVSLDDGLFYNFSYNSWGQIYRVERRAADGSASGRLLSSQEYDLLAPTAAQTGSGTDCPRFTQRKDFIKDWNDDAPAYTTYGTAAGGVQVVKNYQLLSGSQVVDTADTVTQEFTYGASNTWRRGLVTQVKTYWQNALRRTAQTTWTQDDESLPYELNPRARVSEASDPQGNHTGTTVDYTSFGLPTESYEWSGTAATVLRRTHTEYNLDPAYVSRRVIGLVSSVSVYDEQGRVASKVDYTFDQGGQFLQHQGEPAQHDGANYGVGFVLGRGLATSVRRWDVTALHDINKSVESRVGYNTSGSAIFSRDPLGRQASVAYADRFSDAGGTSTLAYPTSVTDTGGFSSKVEYSYHTGQVTRTEDPKGAQQTYTYDDAGRALRVEASARGASGAVVSGGYTRWVYSDAQDAVQAWTQVDVGKPEVCSISAVNGAGMTRSTASDFPGSGGGYRASYVTYDIAGRASKRSNPTEVNGLWNPAGDDAAGWVWTQQTYDWKGRPLVTANAADGATVEIAYGGCGCAGGDTMLTRDEVGRRQKATRDALGRVVKTQALEPQAKTTQLSDVGSVYTTEVTAYNALNQATSVRQYQGTESSGTFQEVLLTYDGHGRPVTSKSPIQTRPQSYVYNADDSLWKVVTPREATGDAAQDVTATYTYNSRRLVTKVEYAVPAALSNSSAANYVPAVGAAEFGYDEVGRRTWMTDGFGRVDYAYDGFSRITSETRQLSDPNNSTITGQSFTLSYGYNLAGGLKFMRDPFGMQVDYQYDSAGQLADVSSQIPGTPAGQVTHFASGFAYRAWGAAKAMNTGDGLHTTSQYDSRMRVSQFKVDGRSAQVGPPTVMLSNYQYYADGRLRFSNDALDARFDRAYSFDLMSRIQDAYTGAEAREFASGQPTGPADGAYRQTYSYDVWGNVTSRTGRYWTEQDNNTDTYNLSGRNTNPDWKYDADGNLKHDDTVAYTWDAAGRAVKRDGSHFSGTTFVFAVSAKGYDGDSQPVFENNTLGFGGSVYSLRSSVTGRVVTEVSWSGLKRRTSVEAGGRTVAHQYGDAQFPSVEWVHSDPVGEAVQRTDKDGRQTSEDMLDPMGASVGRTDPFLEPPPEEEEGVGGDPDMPALIAVPGLHTGNCTLDGVRMQCADLRFLTDNGAIDFCPDNDCGVHADKNGRLVTTGYNPNTGRLGQWHWEQTQVWEVDDEGRKSNPSPGTLYPIFTAGGPTAIPVGFGFRGMFLLGIAGQTGGTGPKAKMSPCEQFLANQFTHDPNTIFVDVNDGDGRDPVTGGDRTYLPIGTKPPFTGMVGETHNHIYNDPAGNVAQATDIYAPAGGIILDSGFTTIRDTYVTVYYPKFGTERDVVLQFIHVVNFNTNLLDTTAGSATQIGQMGPGGGGEWHYGPSDASPLGYHVHINAMKKWWKGSYVRKGKNATQKFLPKEARRHIKLSALCK